MYQVIQNTRFKKLFVNQPALSLVLLYASHCAILKYC